MLEIEKHIPQENWYVGLLWDEGYWFFKTIRKQQLTVFEPYIFNDEVALAVGSTSGWETPTDAQARFYLEPQEEESVYQFFIGLSPSPLELYLQYTQREDRMNLIVPRTVPGPIGFWNGEYTRYLDPSPGTEIWSVHDLRPYFNVCLPGIFDGYAYNDERQLVYASFWITPFTYQVVRDKEKIKSFLRGDKRCTVRTMGDPHRPIKAPGWLIEDYSQCMVQPEEV